MIGDIMIYSVFVVVGLLCALVPRHLLERFRKWNYAMTMQYPWWLRIGIINKPISQSNALFLRLFGWVILVIGALLLYGQFRSF